MLCSAPMRRAGETPNDYVAAALRELRGDTGKTQAELAEAMGLSRSSVANMERGAQRISAEHVCLAARFLSCEPSDLLPSHRELRRMVP